MTADKITQLAQTDPTATIVARWGEAVTEARKRADAFNDALRELDKVTAQLAERKLVVTADLGGPGNAFQHTRKAELADKTADTFSLPARVA